MKQNTLLWDREAYSPRRGAYPCYYEPIMEVVRSNLCISLPLDVLNKCFQLENMCNLITHSLAFYPCENTQKNSKFTIFNRSNVYLDRSKKLKNLYLTICLARLVLDWYQINRKRTFDRSTSNRISIESNRLVTISLDRLKAIFDRSKLVKLEFSRILLKQFS